MPADETLPVLCLAAWVGAHTADALGRWLIAGLLLSAAGDLWLELNRFLPGLGAFLLAHLAYALGFSATCRRLALLRALPFALYGAGIDLFLWPLGPLAGPVLPRLANRSRAESSRDVQGRRAWRSRSSVLAITGLASVGAAALTPFLLNVGVTNQLELATVRECWK